MYRLRLFGGASLVGRAGPVSGRAGQRRPLALLALLGVAGESGLSRAKIVGHLWPKTRERRARHLLSVALHALRKALGSDAIVSVGDDLVLDPGLVEVDVRAFEQALEGGEPQRAIELYDGPFLDGFHVADAPAFERWVDRRREAYARDYRSALEELAEKAEEEAGDWTAAAARWLELAAEDPYSSRVALRLMRALERAGDRPAAVRAARVHAIRVEEELGLEPDPEVVALAERLEYGEVERTVDEPAAAADPAPALTPASRSSNAPTRGGEVEQTGVARAPTAPAGDESPPRLTVRRLAVAIVLLGVLGTLAAARLLSDDAPDLDSRRVLVDRFENRTGEPALDEFGRMAADWITQGLTYTGFVDVLTRGAPILAGQSLTAGAEGADRRERLDHLVRAHGTGTLVWGSFHRRGDSVVFRAHVTDARDGREVASLEPVAASVEAPVAGLEALRDRVMAALATLTDPRLAKWQKHASKPPTFAAYQSFVEGLELHTTERRFREAAERFRAAAEQDPDFTMAKLWEVMSLREVANRKEWDEARRIREELNEKRERLAPLDRAFLDYHLAESEGDDLGELRAARRMVEIAPGSSFLKLAGSAALAARRPAEAVRHFERADPESGWLRGWTPYWRRLAVAHHWLGNYERALEVARRGRDLYPDDTSIRNQELLALAAQGRFEELEAAIADLRGQEHHVGSVLRLVGRELVAHGYERRGREFYGRAIEWTQRRLEEGGTDSRQHRLELVRLLRNVGELTAADSQLAVLLAEDPDDPSVIRAAGLLRAAQGRREEAMEFVRRFDEVGERIYLDFEPEVAALLGERERAMAVLRRFEEVWGLYRFYYLHAPEFRSLWDYPPFHEFMRPQG